MAEELRDGRLLGRRDLLARATLWSLATSMLGGAWLGLRTLWPRAGRASAVRLEAGRPADYAVGQMGDAMLRDHWVWVVRTAEGFIALSARCTHLGCRLRHDTAGKRLACNCHGSTFTLDGQVQRGPAARDLERVFITLSSDGQLLVDPSVRYRREFGEWSQPGAFVRFSPEGRDA